MEPYLGEIRIFPGNFAPQGWLYCQGQLLSISEYSALFQLLGTTYGGDGQNSFGLPNLSSRVVVGQGPLPGGSTYQMGQALGTENVTLTSPQLPTHNHPITSGAVNVISGGTSSTSPNGNYFGDKGSTTYSAALGSAPGTLGSGAVVGQSGPAGSSQPHTNIQPVLATSYIICTEGIYPSQN